MKITILDRTKKKKFVQGCQELGLSKINELLVRSGESRIRAYSGNLSNEEIMELWRLLPIEAVGLYVAKENVDKNGRKELRLSVDALHIWKDQINKNVLVLSSEQEVEWFKSNKIDFEEPIKLKGFVAVKSSDSKDFIGTGKVSEDGKKLFGYLPKERRRKESVI